jgi:hypothetical protein
LYENALGREQVTVISLSDYCNWEYIGFRNATFACNFNTLDSIDLKFGIEHLKNYILRRPL